MVPFVLAQQVIGRRRSRSSLGGKFSARRVELRRWRWPIFAALVALLAAMTLLPVCLMVLGSFMEVFGYFDVPGGVLTTEHWLTVLRDPMFLHAVRDTLSIAAGSAAASMLLFPAIAYLIVRTRQQGRGLLDFLTWIPTTVPGIVIGLALLWMFLRTPFLRPAYGTDLGLILAFLIAGMALGVQLSKAAMMQISLELEDAARAGGASWLTTLCRVVLPLVAPTIVAVGVLQFVAATRAVSTAVLLSSNATQTLAVFQLKFIESGDLEAASVVGVIVLVLTTGVAFAARAFGLKLGLGGR
jgi:iron(III) transport system permease protein